jgi:hypothetical protein
MLPILDLFAMSAGSCRPGAEHQPRPALGIRLAYIREVVGRKAGGPGWPGSQGLEDFSGSSPASGGNTASHDQSAADGAKERRSGERNQRSGSRIGGGSSRGPEKGRDPWPAGASPAAREGRVSHEQPTYDRDEPVRAVRRSPEECRLLPGLRPFLLLVGVLQAAPRAARRAARVDRVVSERPPARRQAGPGRRAGGRLLNENIAAEDGCPLKRRRVGTSRGARWDGGPGLGRGEA